MAEYFARLDVLFILLWYSGLRQLSATCFETMYSNKPDITSSYDIMFTTVALSKHVVAWSVNYFFGNGSKIGCNKQQDGPTVAFTSLCNLILYYTVPKPLQERHILYSWAEHASKVLSIRGRKELIQGALV